MIHFLTDSGLLGLTFWVLGTAGLVVLLRRLWTAHCFGPPEPRPNPGLAFLGSPLFVFLLGIGTLLNVGLAVYKGYVAPHDIMQDIISAREFLAGRSPYPSDMTVRITDAVHEEPPPFSLLTWSDDLRQREIDEREAGIHRPWVQAHPPLMTLVYVPLVGSLNIYGTFAVVTGLSLTAMVVSLILVLRGLQLQLTALETTSVVLFVLGCAPTLSVLRLGQPSWILTSLLIGCWYCILPRASTTRSAQLAVLAGILAAVAAMLKLFPALIVVYFLLRFVASLRDGFRWLNLLPILSAVLTGLLLLVGVGFIFGWECYGEHIETAKGIVPGYAAYSSNLSLLGPIARTEQWLRHRQLTLMPWATEFADGIRHVSTGILVVGVAGVCLLVLGPGRPRDENRRTTLEFGLFLALMPVLSPIAWDNYLVLLLLPLAILGRSALGQTSSTSKVLAWLALVGILAAPFTTFEWLNNILHPLIGGLLGNLLIFSFRTVLMVGVAAWLAWAIRRDMRYASPV